MNYMQIILLRAVCDRKREHPLTKKHEDLDVRDCLGMKQQNWRKIVTSGIPVLPDMLLTK